MTMNSIKTWRQGEFIDQRLYSKMANDWKDERRRDERHLVRSGPTDKAICHCPNPDDAEWIAQRLNLASNLEQLTYDFAFGKTDGQELVNFVREACDQ